VTPRLPADRATVFVPDLFAHVRLRLPASAPALAVLQGSAPGGLLNAVVTWKTGPVVVLDCADGRRRWAHVEDVVPPEGAPALP
jgi:hypothetical protein